MSDEKGLTDQDLKKLARDIRHGHVFTSLQIPQGQERLFPMIFLPIAFMGKEKLEWLADKVGEKGFIYEYMKNAGPREVNGYPIFFSMKVLTTPEAEKVLEFLLEIERREAEYEREEI